MSDFPPSILLKLEGLFAADGILTTRYGLHHRASQLKMMGTICAALSSKRGALIEACTGTGKTFAYLFPAAEFLLHSRAQGYSPRVVISTATRNLQDQLSHKDFPVLAGIYPDLKFFTWKGASNYLCLNRLEHAACKKSALSEEAANLWAMQGDLSELDSGTRDELPHSITDELWSEICGSTPACCKPSDRHHCYKRHAFRRARESDILCLNHALTASLGLYAGLLHPAMPSPEETLLILDEGHEFQNHIRGALNQNFSLTHLTHLIDRLQEDSRGELKAENKRMAIALGFLLPEDDPLHVTEEDSNIVHQLKKLGQLMRRVSMEMKSEYEWNVEQGFYEDERDRQDASAAFTSLHGHADKLLRHIEGFPPDCMLEVGKRGKSIRISLSPFTYAAELRQIYDYSAIPPIVTSATLISGTHAQALQRYCLTPEQVLVKKLDGEFDYPSSVRGYFFPQIPAKDINEPAALVPWLQQILPLSHGNALVLFTSYRVLDSVFAELRDWGAAQGYTMLSQSGEEPVKDLVSRMKSQHNCVIFGNAALWTGVNVKGANLSSVIITKLPFLPIDNFFAAYSAYLESQNRDPFHSWTFPEMVGRLRQGIGRLKRDEADRGLIFILDPRFTTASYRDHLLGKLPLIRWSKVLTGADLPNAETTQSWLGVRAPLPAGAALVSDTTDKPPF